MEEEIWRDVGIIKGVDYTGLYQVSNYGQVRSLDRLDIDKRGYRCNKGGIILYQLDQSLYQSSSSIMVQRAE